MSFRSWLGALSCFWIWLLAHRFSAGWAAPSFLVLCLACVYLWFLVLRVPKLGQELAEAWPEAEEEIEKVEEVCAPASEAAVPMSEAQVAESYPEYQPEAWPHLVAHAKRLSEASAELDAEAEPQGEEPGEEEAQVEVDDLVDPAKAQELRQKGNEDFKAGWTLPKDDEGM